MAHRLSALTLVIVLWLSAAHSSAAAVAPEDPATVGSTAPASAEPPPPSPDDQPPAQADAGTPPPAVPNQEAGSPIAEEPAPGDGSPPDAAPPEAQSPDEPNPQGPEPETPDAGEVDPLIGEAPGEAPPDGEVEVPDRPGYGDQGQFKPAEILWSSVAAAESKLADAVAARNDTIAEARILRLQEKRLRSETGELADQTSEAVEELARIVDSLEARAVAGFRIHSTGASVGGGQLSLDHAAIVEQQRRSRLRDAGLTVGKDELARMGDIRTALDADTRALVDRTATVRSALAEVESIAVQLGYEAEQAQIEYEAFRAGSEVFVDGVVFPIAGEYGTLIDSYGFPRMPGTDDAHWHEGIDIFADRGTPLVATERGVVTRIGVGRLGGLKFWLVGESGSEWYYAHLDSFAPGLTDGLVVDAGQLLGYVGNTGNAVGTPPHLHMELHPAGVRPVNPFPLLNIVAQRDQSALAAGFAPLFQYTSVVAGQPASDVPSSTAPPSSPAPPSSTAPASSTVPSTVPNESADAIPPTTAPVAPGPPEPVPVEPVPTEPGIEKEPDIETESGADPIASGG